MHKALRRLVKFLGLGRRKATHEPCRAQGRSGVSKRKINVRTGIRTRRSS